MKKPKKKIPNKEVIKGIENAMLEGTVHTLTAEEKAKKENELRTRQKKVFLKSAILSTLMLYNTDDLIELGAPIQKLKSYAVNYNKHLEFYLNKVFDITNDEEAGRFIEESTRIVDTMLDEYVEKHSKD